jgi:hypothetical protein
MLTLLRQRNFALLWWWQLISTLGDWILVIALPYGTTVPDDVENPFR